MKIEFFFWMGTAIMVFSVLCMLIIVVLYRNKVLKMKKAESENLLNISLDIEKRERKRIASDLHDGISGDLSAVRNYLAVLGRKPYHSTSDKGIFRDLDSSLSKVLKDVQDISYNLMPPTLESLGLQSTLRSYFDRVRKWYNIEVNDTYDTENIALPAYTAYEVYRIVQELTTNAIKHGHPARIAFTMYKDDKHLTFSISDDGDAFDFYKSVKATSGMGLKNIVSRMRHLRGNLKQLPEANGNKLQIILKIQ